MIQATTTILLCLGKLSPELDWKSSGDSAPIELLLQLIHRRRSMPEEHARPIGERIFAVKPNRFTKRLNQYCKVWRKFEAEVDPLRGSRKRFRFVNTSTSACLRLLLAVVLGVFSATVVFAGGAQPVVGVPAGVNHELYARLLKKYVDHRGLVDYAGWKENANDVAALDLYLKQFARRGYPARGDEQVASLINAYNAFMIKWILENFPVESVWRTERPFAMPRHEVNGKMVSLDQIEKESLIPLIGWKAHPVLVCGARSCPPLRRDAYRADEVEAQISNACRAWLGRNDLNSFVPARKRVEISRIFKWYSGDFANVDGGVKKILEVFGPKQFRKFLSGRDYTIKYKSYDWGLNDQGAEGKGYSRIELLWDNFF
jgi:hypothetical protein